MKILCWNKVSLSSFLLYSDSDIAGLNVVVQEEQSSAEEYSILIYNLIIWPTYICQIWKLHSSDQQPISSSTSPDQERSHLWKMSTLLPSWNMTLRLRLRLPGNIQTVWYRPECFEIMWNYPDSLNPVRKIWDHLKIYWQLWNCPEKLRSSGKLRTVLKPSGKFEIVWKNLDSVEFETVWKTWNNLEKSGKF